MNYYEHYLGNYNKKTGHLRMEGHGAYRMLLDHYYSTERPLPASHADLYVICKAFEKREQATVRAVADEFFPVDADGLRHNERADVEIDRAVRRMDASRANGKKGGRKPRPEPRREPKANPTGNPDRTYKEPDPDNVPQPEGLMPHASPLPIGRGKTKAASPLAPPGVRPEVWDAWRRHRGRKLTPDAVRLQTAKLADLAKQGHDPNAVIEQSIANTWAGLFALPGQPHGKGKTKEDKLAATAAEMRMPDRGNDEEPTDITAHSQRIA